MKKFAPSIFVLSALFSIGCSDSAPPANANVAVVQSTPVAATPAPTAPEVPTEFTSAAEALAAGNALFDNGDTEQSIAVFEKAVALDANLAEAHFRLGMAFSLIEAQDQSVTEVPDPTPTPKGKKAPKETKLKSEKAFESAVASYKKLIAANKKDDVAHFYLGLAYNKLNEDEDAAKALKEAVKIKPENTEYQTELGSVLIKLAKYPEAVGVLKKAIVLDATNTKAEDLLAKAEAGRRRVDFSRKDDKKPEPSGAPSRRDSKQQDSSSENSKSKGDKPSDSKNDRDSKSDNKQKAQPKP